MKILPLPSLRTAACLLMLLLFSVPGSYTYAQKKLNIGLHADPSINWFSSDTKVVSNDGVRPGFNFGLTITRSFTENYSFSTGINLITSGGSLVNSDTTVMEFNNFTSEVPPGEPIIYSIKYLSVPVGLKLQTNQIGYITFFTDIGLDPKYITGGRIEIPYLDIAKENAAKELKEFNLGYHVTAGIEYSLGGTTALVLGLSYDSNFLDITEDTGDQPVDKISHKLLSFRIGMNF